jgi:hypothetical protein
MPKRRLKLIGKILLGIVLLLVAFLLVERWRGQIALASFKKQLLANGERLSPADFVQDFNEAENGAPAVMAAIAKLQEGKILPHNVPDQMHILASGRAKASFLEPWWITKGGMVDGKWSLNLVVNDWAQLKRDLATNAKALVEARQALNKPVLNNNLNYSLGPKMKAPYLIKTKSLARWFGGATQLALHEGNQTVALENLLAAIRLLAMLENDHIIMSEHVRYAIGAIAKSHTWEALQASGWTDPELVQLQNAWHSQSYAPGMVSALEWELTSMLIHHNQLRASNDETYQFLVSLDLMEVLLEPILKALKSGAGSDEDDAEDSPSWLKHLSDFIRRQVYCRVWRFSWSHQAELKDLKTAYAALEFARRVEPSSDQGAFKSELANWLGKFEKPGFYDRLRYLPIELSGAYGKFVERPPRMETDRSLIIAAIALKRYHRRHGEFPDRLVTLVPEFCPAIPIDWMDGKPIKYHRNEDGRFTLYSVGEDGEDNGGDLSPPEGSKTRDLWRRRDYVWPAPATPEELEEFRQQALAD